MKKLLMTILFTSLLLTPVLAQVYTIPDEPQPTITRHRIAQVRIDNVNKRVYVYIQGGYLDGADFVALKNFKIEFMNIPDDPSTPEDETSNEFNQFINVSGITQAGVITAVKAKLGL